MDVHSKSIVIFPRIHKAQWSCIKGDHSQIPDQIRRDQIRQVRDRCEGKQSCFIDPRMLDVGCPGKFYPVFIDSV